MVFSGLWAYEAYAGTAYEEKEEIVSSYTQYGSYAYTAPVTESNPLYTKGTVLEMGKPAYFFAVSPTVDISFTYRLKATDSADISVMRKTVIVATSKEVAEEEGKEDRIFWQKEFPLKSKKPVDIENGELLTETFSVNVSEVQSMVKGVQDQLKYSQGATVEIVNRVNCEGNINGKYVNRTKDFAIPLVIDSSYYKMPEKLEFNESTDVYKKIRVQNNPSLSSIKKPLAIFLLSMVFIGTILPCRKMKKTDQIYIKKLEIEQRRLPLKEFVSKGKLPENIGSLIRVEISSLQELVDAAFDMNERVIYDNENGVCFIIHGGVLYFWHEST
ncbi:MAG: DUF5305 domain-containing protein [Methanosarcina vacuolata]|jgi:hypothetical protein|nr:DUF5305 domain-containing protein [Methanosarcina vacuolata]